MRINGSMTYTQIQQNRTSREDIENRQTFRNKIRKLKGFQEKENERRGRIIT